MEYTLFTYASRAHSRVKLLAISDIHQYINVVCAHKYDGNVQHKCLTYTILNCLDAALFLASNPPSSSNPDLHALPSLKETMMMMMIAFITFKSSLVPLLEGL